MNIAQIRKYDVANGPGIRVSVFVSGCSHNCYGCFNKEYQDYSYGEKFTDNIVDVLQSELNKPHISGLSLLGGEPMDFPDKLTYLISALRFKDYQNIWIWSGYTLEEILLDTDKTKLLKLCDVLVDGPFKLNQKNLNLKFRGSENQRIIDIHKSLNSKALVTLKED